MNASSTPSSPSSIETAVLGGGCFWCVEATFDELKGVERVESGYAGGTVANPTYEQVCSGNTGHAEVIRVSYHPDHISFKEILEVFFTVHDPTTLNRQGADAGTQYRSVIFYENERQKALAEQIIREVSEAGLYENKIVTEISPLVEFYPAEAYHQDYYNRNGEQTYCRYVISPKMKKFRERFKDKLK